MYWFPVSLKAGTFCTIISPDSAFWNANTTNSTASSKLIEQQVIDGSVIGSQFLPAFICSIHSVSQNLLNWLFPYLVQQMCLSFPEILFVIFALITFSPSWLWSSHRYWAGYAALSVDRQITFYSSFNLLQLLSIHSHFLKYWFTAQLGKIHALKVLDFEIPCMESIIYIDHLAFLTDWMSLTSAYARFSFTQFRIFCDIHDAYHHSCSRLEENADFFDIRIEKTDLKLHLPSLRPTLFPPVINKTFSHDIIFSPLFFGLFSLLYDTM